VGKEKQILEEREMLKQTDRQTGRKKERKKEKTNNR
jgi:hypothetical protein